MSLFHSIHLFFQEQIKEIQAEKSLRWYGFFLTLSHVFTYLLWNKSGDHHLSILNDSVVVCWTFFQDCAIPRAWVSQHLSAVLNIYLFFSLFVSLAFLNQKMIQSAYWGLSFLSAFKFSIFILDYRMMGNYHYMNFISLLFFLLIPHKIKTAQYLIVAFYLGAGILRFNSDWFSGVALGRQTLLEGKVLEWAMAYVIFLELCISFLLFSKRSAIFWFAFLQFAAFHLFSSTIVGFYFPVIMFCGLSIFILDRSWPAAYNSSMSRWWGYVALIAFIFAQLYPAIKYPDSAVTGEGRLIALNMFDGRIQCDKRMIIKYKDQTIEKTIPDPNVGSRIFCDPLYYFYYVKSVCDELRQTENFIDIDFSIYSKRRTESAYRLTLKAQNFCSRPPKVSFLGSFQYE